MQVTSCLMLPLQPALLILASSFFEFHNQFGVLHVEPEKLLALKL